MYLRVIATLILIVPSCHATGSARDDGKQTTATAANARDAAVVVPESRVVSGAIVTQDPRAHYDLAADLESRRQLAVSHFGDRVRLSVVEDVFLVVGAPPMRRTMFERSLRLIRSSTAAYFNKRFSKRPPRAVTVYLFATKRSYNRYCDAHHGGCGTPYGVYYREPRRIVMNAGPGLGTLTHELVHPIVEADFPGAPDWIDEGIASLFERPHIPRAGEIHGKTNWRHPALKRALRTARGRSFANLKLLFSMSDEQFRGDSEGLNYALARYFCQWMDEKGKLWDFYQLWRDNRATDRAGRKAFKSVMGVTPAEANKEWTNWVRRL